MLDHVFYDPSTLEVTGVIDFEPKCGDPMIDLAVLGYHYPEALPPFLDGYHPEMDDLGVRMDVYRLTRALGCARWNHERGLHRRPGGGPGAHRAAARRAVKTDSRTVAYIVSRLLGSHAEVELVEKESVLYRASAAKTPTVFPRSLPGDICCGGKGLMTPHTRQTVRGTPVSLHRTQHWSPHLSPPILNPTVAIQPLD